ncbi:MAG: GTP cyclohydrolase I [Patescibacteria group bacterium]
MKKIKNYSDEELIIELIKRIGENPKRIGLLKTPSRVARSWGELYFGYDQNRKPEITTFPNGEDGLFYNEMILDTGTFNSTCEHHLLPFFGKYYFGYIPSKEGKVLGISKVARIVAFCSAKLQIQERLTVEVVQTLWEALSDNLLEPRGMALVLIGTHMCKSMRGVKKDGVMTTIELRGLFKNNQSTRNEFLQMTRESK